MTKEEYIRHFTEQMEMPVEVQQEIGLEPVPCRCGLRNCPGWQMVPPGMTPYAVEG